MHIHVSHLIHQYGYWGVFFILLIEMIGIPFPAETTLTFSGIEWAKGTFSLVPLLFAAAGGNFIGTSIAYYIGRFLGRPFIVRFGKRIGLTDARLDQAEIKFKHFRIPILLFSKFIAGIRVMVPYLAGINKMPFFVFSIFNAISAFTWTAVFIVLGRYVGIAWNRHHQIIHQILLPTVIIVIPLVILYAIRKNKRKLVEN